MKKALLSIVVVLCLCIPVFPETTSLEILWEYQREIENFRNGCGPEGYELFTDILNSISSGERIDACNIHDIDYGTLGMSKEEADSKFLDKFGDCPFLKEDFASWSETQMIFYS